MNSFLMDILEQGFIFGIMALGVYITFNILDFPDMSVDGSFPLGAAVTSAFLMHGANPYVAVLISAIAGAAAGAATGLIHVKLKITNILSGILVMIGLYSINLRIMGKSNVPLFNVKTIFIDGIPNIAVLLVFALVVKFMLDFFLKTKFGFVLRATGDNPQMVTSLCMDTGNVKIIGLMISNALVAVSGSLMAQFQGFSDAGMGTGTIVMGLASIIMGMAIFKKIPFISSTSMVILGCIMYKACISAALKLGLPPTDLKLITAVIVVIALSLGRTSLKLGFKKRKTAGGDTVASNKKAVQSI